MREVPQVMPLTYFQRKAHTAPRPSAETHSAGRQRGGEALGWSSQNSFEDLSPSCPWKEKRRGGEASLWRGRECLWLHPESPHLLLYWPDLIPLLSTLETFHKLSDDGKGLYLTEVEVSHLALPETGPAQPSSPPPMPGAFFSLRISNRLSEASQAAGPPASNYRLYILLAAKAALGAWQTDFIFFR